jgi:hypothetical protein
LQLIEIIIQNLQTFVDKIKYMKKILISSMLLLTLSGLSKQSFGWGKKGHELTGSLAWHFLDDSTRKIVMNYLGNLSFEEAANWMDDVRSNSYFEFQRKWHYVDFEKGTKYEPTSERDLLTVLHSSIAQIRQYKTIKKKDVKRALLLIFHLVGDMHQPLHCGYASDRGGNDVAITSDVVSGNLHSVWDTDMLLYKQINMDSCLDVYKTMDSATIANSIKINELKWVYESRSHLDTVYSFNNNFLDVRYVDSNSETIKKQLVLAGLRLAAIFRSTFNPDAKLP